jgi:hypothetical protein
MRLFGCNFKKYRPPKAGIVENQIIFTFIALSDFAESLISHEVIVIRLSLVYGALSFF